MAAERADEARKVADRLACEAWNKRMLGFNGPAQPSPMLGDALNAGYRYLEVRCLGCDTNQTVVFDIVRRPNANPRARAVHALQGLLAGPGLCLQAEPSGRAARDQDHRERPALDVVAGRTIMSNLEWPK